jgi:hypothetical protein
MIRKFPMKEDLLTSEELSKYINITPGGWALRRSRNDGPPFIKIKNDVRYLWEDVLKWILKESSSKAFIHKRNELLYKRFEEIKSEMPIYNRKKISQIIAHEFNLTTGTTYLYICNYMKEKKEESKNTKISIFDVQKEALSSLKSPLNISKKSNLSELGSAILSILKSKNSINNKNL